MPRIAIVAALSREVHALVHGWQRSRQEYAGREFEFFEHGDYVALCGGIGAEAARRATEAVIALYKPTVVYSAGFAGALEPKLKIGDIVVPSRVVNASDGSRLEMEEGSGVLVTFGSVANPEQKARLRESYGAQAVDMEAAAVARAAEARGVRFAAVKAISDVSSFEFPAMEGFISPAGRFQTGKFAFFAIVRPWLWGRALELARNSRRASRSLCDWLQTMVAREQSIPGGRTTATEAVHRS